MGSPPKREVLLLACALCAISFAAGIGADRFLSRLALVEELREAVASVYTNLVLPRVREPWERQHYYFPTRQGGEGVVLHDVAATYPGYTLFSASFEPAAYLIDMQGRPVHSWRLPFSAAWRSPPHIEWPVPDKYVFFRRTHLFPNGDLLAIYEAPGHWPYAYGMVKLDRNSRVLWRHADLVNHDLEVAADGTIFTLAHQVRRKPEPELARLSQKIVIDDAVLILSPEGKALRRISVLNAFVASRFAPMLERGRSKDLIHTNSLQLVTPEIARIFPFAHTGQILLSHNTLGIISILDPRSGKIVWARRVSHATQHSARFLPNGTIGLFQNSDDMGGGSRVVMLDPATGGVSWSFTGDEHFKFHSDTRGSIQMLPNGNILITESNAGRVFEVTRARKIVWEYRVGHHVHGMTPAIFEALRIEPRTLEFIPRDAGAGSKP